MINCNHHSVTRYTNDWALSWMTITKSMENKANNQFKYTSINCVESGPLHVVQVEKLYHCWNSCIENESVAIPKKSKRKKYAERFYSLKKCKMCVCITLSAWTINDATTVTTFNLQSIKTSPYYGLHIFVRINCKHNDKCTKKCFEIYVVVDDWQTNGVLALGY